MILEKYRHIKTPDEILYAVNKIFDNNKEEKLQQLDFKQYNLMLRDQKGFIKDCLSYRHEKGAKSSVIPFQSYYPTFESMDIYRRQFYFYWRNEAVEGRFIDTEISYIFLFIYELINYGYSLDAAFNISMMENIYRHYIYRYPKLEQYLPMWMSDFLFELGETELALEWGQSQSTKHDEYEELKNAESSLRMISMNTWWKYIPNRSRSHFFASNKQKIYTMFKNSIEYLQKKYLSESEDEGIFEHLFPLREVTVEREFYKSAILDRETFPRSLTLIKRELDKQYCLFLAELMRVAENIVRKQMNESDFILIDHEKFPKTLEEELVHKFSRFTKVSEKNENEMGSEIPLPPMDNEKIITFDFEKIDVLNKESSELQEIFEEKYGDKEDEIETLAIEKNHSTDLSSLFSSNELEEESINDFIQSLSDTEKDFLRFVRDNGLAIKNASSYLKSKGIMFGSFIIDLNEKAEEYLEDTLLEEDGEELSVTEEFIFILDKI